MLIISKFPKSIAGCTKCPRGRHAARVFETPEFILDIYFLRLSMHCAGSITIMRSVNVFINDFTLICRRKKQSCQVIIACPVHSLESVSTLILC